MRDREAVRGAELIRVLLRAASAVRGELDRALSEHGLTTEQWLVLDALVRQDGRLQGELARELGKDKSTVTRTVDLLERREWVEREIDENDGRRRGAWLTAKGRALMQATRRAVQDRIDGFSGHVNAEAAARMTDALNGMADAFKWR